MNTVNLYDKIIANFPTWYPSLKAFCCKRKSATIVTAPPPPNKEIKSTIECEQIIKASNGKQGQTQGNNTRMDAVVHYMTTIPAIRNLICMTHHDYLPNERSEEHTSELQSH